MLKKNKNYQALLIIILSLPYITSNVLYFDDIFRNARYYSDWSSDGRPLADALYFMLTFGNGMSDLFPLPLILSIIIYFAVYTRLVDTITKGRRSFLSIYSYLSIIASPFFISNMSFRYDSFFMLLSVSIAAIPFVIHIKNKILECISNVTLLVCCFSLYQTSVNIFLGLCVIKSFLVYMDEKNFKKSISCLYMSALSFIFAYFIYSNFILNTISLNAYFINYSSSLGFSHNGIIGILNNIVSSMKPVIVLLKSGFGIPLLICYALSTVAVFRKSYESKCVFLFIYYFFSICIIATLSAGVALAAQFPSFYARIYLGFGLLILFPCIIIERTICNEYIKLVFTAPLFIFLFSFTYVSSNVIKEHYNYSDMVANDIVDKINSLELSNVRRVVFAGKAPTSNLVSSTLESMPFISYLLPSTFRDNYDAGRFLLMKNGLNDGLNEITYPDQKDRDEILKMASKAKPIYSSYLYNMYYLNEVICIEFKSRG